MRNEGRTYANLIFHVIGKSCDQARPPVFIGGISPLIVRNLTFYPSLFDLHTRYNRDKKIRTYELRRIFLAKKKKNKNKQILFCSRLKLAQYQHARILIFRSHYTFKYSYHLIVHLCITIIILYNFVFVILEIFLSLFSFINDY